jgi:Flp pilus assembly protein TadG
MPIAKQIIRTDAARLVGRRFLGSDGGGAAVDFALVLLPFLVVLMAIIESAVFLLAGQVLQTSATNAARLILTGQAQNAGDTAAQFKSTVCATLTVMFNCANNLYVDVESFSSFSNISLPSPTNSNGAVNSGSFGYSPGNPGDIVVVRLIYQWPILATGLGLWGKNANTLVATVAFRNEPYGSAT